MGLTNRILDAIESLRGPSKTTTLGLERPAKSAMQFPVSQTLQNYGPQQIMQAQGWWDWSNTSMYQRSTGTQINYAREVGDLTQSSLVMSAVNWAGRTIPEPPIMVQEEDEDGNLTIVPKHPFTQLMKRPNPYYAGFVMWISFALNWIINGNVYWVKERNRLNQVFRLWPIPYWMMWPVASADPTVWIDHYNYRVNNKIIEYSVSEVIHFRNGQDTKNDRMGVSPLWSLLREIYSDIEIANWFALLMRHSGIPPIMITPESGAIIEDDERDRLSAQLDHKRGGDNRGKSVVASGGVRIEQMMINPKDMALDVLHGVPIERLCTVLGIPSLVLGFNTDPGTYSNTEMADRRAYETWLSPLWKGMDDELTHQILIPDFEGGNEDSPLCVRHDLRKVAALQEDANELVEREVLKWTNGLSKRSESRAALQLSVDEAADNVYFTDIIPPSPPKPAGFGLIQKPLGDGAKRLKPRSGKWGQKYIDQISATDSDDIESATEWLNANVPDRFKGILDATNGNGAS